MADNSDDFKKKVRAIGKLPDGVAMRECYGTSNSAKFVTGGFLCGIPNIDSVEKSAGALCVFSKIQLSPSSELHTAIVIHRSFGSLIERMEAMVAKSGEFFADKNNNCALFLASDENVYVYNKAKVTFELTSDVLKTIGPGFEPDALYWGVYGDQGDAVGGPVAQLSKLVGQDRFVEIDVTASPSGGTPPAEADRGLNNISTQFYSDLSRAQMCLRKGMFERFAAALLSKRFVVVTGLAGSGKTKLAQAFAKWITPDPGLIDAADLTKGKKHNACYTLVAVGADWTGNENILGYPNGLKDSEYVTKPALDLILHASMHRDEPHFLILDEMNLSHVERYFADILSVIESDERIQLYRNTDRSANGVAVPFELELPKNLFIIGTVNVDETTYMFSPKVLDRANVIEFRMEAAELGAFLTDPAKPDLDKLDGRGSSAFGKAFVEAAVSRTKIPHEAKVSFDSEMLLFFNVLQVHGAEFGYRVVHEAARFLCFYKTLGVQPNDVTWFSSAFDCIIVQKFLPKLHGSRSKLGPLLKSLWFLTARSVEARGENPLTAANESARLTDSAAEPSTNVNADAVYPLAAEKIGRMWRLLRDNGFASFAEA